MKLRFLCFKLDCQERRDLNIDKQFRKNVVRFRWNSKYNLQVCR